MKSKMKEQWDYENPIILSLRRSVNTQEWLEQPLRK